MNFDQREVEAGAAMARRALGKPEPGTTPKTQAERMAEWSKAREAERQAAATAAPARSAPAYTKRDLHTPGSAYQLGSERYAADGTLWRRTG
ncbi:hypothetical protein [Methylobacterium sp. WL6]|uniref:hypothetical protein n=1 Tax=Methylobacterium sp. WL6 TaxID=2603901 RepID=UPI0011CA1AC8|nr:hypothetical protein [Methylobacterium sp. WL6]TXN72701.1 hypothetical protein FV230_03965 [Methylobacterium sp. WL6]